MSSQTGIIIMEEEPVLPMVLKWLGWVVLLTLFLMFIIYFSECFAREGYHNEDYSGVPSDDLRRARAFYYIRKRLAN